MYAQLGLTVFDGLVGFHDFERVAEAKYAEVDLIGGKPDLQRTGDALIDITIGVRLHESFCNPEDNFAQFEGYRVNGDILPFVNGYGTLLGNYVIEKLKQTVLNLDTSGRVTLCECELTLKEFVDPNRAVTVSSNAKANAFAVDNTSLTAISAGVPSNPNAVIFGSLSDLSDSLGGATASVKATGKDAANVASYFKNALAEVNKAYTTANDLQTKIEVYISEGVGAYTGMVDTLTAVKSNITSLKTAIVAGNVGAAISGVSVFGSSVYQLNSLALPVQKFLIMR